MHATTVQTCLEVIHSLGRQCLQMKDVARMRTLPWRWQSSITMETFCCSPWRICTEKCIIRPFNVQKRSTCLAHHARQSAAHITVWDDGVWHDVRWQFIEPRRTRAFDWGCSLGKAARAIPEERTVSSIHNPSSDSACCVGGKWKWHLYHFSSLKVNHLLSN